MGMGFAGCVAEVGDEFGESEGEGGNKPFSGNGCAGVTTDACVAYKTGLGEVISLSTACAFRERLPGKTVLFSFERLPGWVPSLSYNASPDSITDVHGAGCSGTALTYTPGAAACRAGVPHGATGALGVWQDGFCIVPVGIPGGEF